MTSNCITQWYYRKKNTALAQEKCVLNSRSAEMGKYNCFHKIGNAAFRVIGYTVKGFNKKENQDNFGVYSDNTQMVAVLADGLGSAKLSGEGSKKMIKTAINILSSENDLPDDLPRKIMDKWSDGFEGPLSQYDTTMKFVKIKNDEIWYGGIGDGWIAINTNDGYFEVVSGSEFTNQTDSILSEKLADKFVIESLKTKTFKILLMSTDGFSEDFEKDKIIPFLEESYSTISKDPKSYQDNLCKLLDNWPIQTNLDDKTVLVIKGEC